MGNILRRAHQKFVWGSDVPLVRNISFAKKISLGASIRVTRRVNMYHWISVNVNYTLPLRSCR